MNKREQKVALLETMRAMHASLEAMRPTAGPDWTDLVWVRQEVPRLEADLAEYDRIQQHAAAVSSSTNVTTLQDAPRAQLGRPVTAESMKELDAVYRRAARSQGHTVRSVGGLPLMSALAMLAMVPQRLLPANFVRRLLPGQPR